MFRLPQIATAPFCPSEIQGSINISSNEPIWRKIFKFIGPGLLVSVGYMDPGNWATDIEAGSKYGYTLLWVVLLSSFAAMQLQVLSMRLGLVTQKDLARHCREQMSPWAVKALWILAEIAIVATDLAEVLGSALAFHLLFGISLAGGVALMALDTFIVLGLKGKGFRQLEAIILGLISTIGICYFVELWLVKPDWSQVGYGLLPRVSTLSSKESLYLAIGILGATVMPHNLYLHSSIVQTRKVSNSKNGLREALKYSTLDTVVSLFLAFIVNAAILVLAACAFHHAGGGNSVVEIDTAYRMLDPIVGSKLGSFLFGIALLASGQSSTFTGTIAAQILMEGFVEIKMPCWKRRLITRSLALLPAFCGVLMLGEGATGRMLVLSQVVLSLQLPFAIYPLVKFTSRSSIMGTFAAGSLMRLVGWILFVLISVANLWLVFEVL